MSLDINQPQNYWNWALSTWTYNGYSNVVNFDIVAPSYTFDRNKMRPTSFYYKKRKWYFDVLPEDIAINYKNRDVSDHIVIKEWACWSEVTTHYVYLVNRSTWRSKIITRNWDCDDVNNYHDLCWWDWLDPKECYDCICPCWFDKFFITDFVRWTPRTLSSFWIVYWSLTWVQENTNNWTVWKFYDLWVVEFPNVQIWDWIYVWESPLDEWDAVCWQARQVVSIEYATNAVPYDVLVLNAPRVWLWSTNMNIDNALNKVNQARTELQVAINSWDINAITEAQTMLDAQLQIYELEKSLWPVTNEQKWINAWYSVYPERWEVVSYMTCLWLTTIHSLHRYRDANTWEVIEDFVSDRTTACSWFNSDICVYSVTEFNWRINMLGSSGYNIFWWYSYDKLSFSVDNQNYVWSDKVSQAVFRNFLVSFSDRGMSVIVYDANWNSFAYPLDSSIGIFSPHAYQVFQNSLYIVWTDKRLYSCDISSWWAWAWYMLSLTDQSQAIRWELELMQHWDDINLYNDGNKLMIFLNNKTNREDSKNTKTKILIYHRDYNRRVSHHICNFVVNGKSWDYYIWDSLYLPLYNFPYNKDYDTNRTPNTTWDPNPWKFFTAYIEAYIWENEDWSNWKLSTFALKAPVRAKITLWKWLYTDWSTKFILDYWSHWRQEQYQIDKVEHIERIESNNIAAMWWEVLPPECVLKSMSECSNVVRECSKSNKKEWWTYFSRNCKEEEDFFNDNCICVDDKWFALSDIYNVVVKLDHIKKSELFKIRIVSEWWDLMTFWWMIVWLQVNDISVHDVDNEDLLNNGDSCCVSWVYINNNDPCWCLS